MCGRFTQAYTWVEVKAFLELVGPARNLRPHYNLAPTDTIDVVRLGVGGRELVPRRWVLIPSWWGRPLNELLATFNARAETVLVKAMFQSAFFASPLGHPRFLCSPWPLTMSATVTRELRCRLSCHA